jgi:hypothetical protein
MCFVAARSGEGSAVLTAQMEVLPSSDAVFVISAAFLFAVVDVFTMTDLSGGFS